MSRSRRSDVSLLPFVAFFVVLGTRYPSVLLFNIIAPMLAGYWLMYALTVLLGWCCR